MITPPGVATRKVWGPILIKYCRVQYNEGTRQLEIMKGKVVGRRQPTRHASLVEDSKSDDDDDDDGDEGDNNDDFDNDDGQVPFDVFAGYISPGLCFSF